MTGANSPKTVGKSHCPASGKAEKLRDLIRERVNRQTAFSLVSCVHCGACAQACHYALARPHDPCMTPAYKADQIRRIFNRQVDWIGRIFPRSARAETPADDGDLNNLKDIVFGTCSVCRRCTFNCPMGVDNAALIRLTRGILTELGIVPEGLSNVCKNQQETGNQMRISREEFLDTISWIKDEVRNELGDSDADIPVDKPDSDFLYAINPREIKFDPRSLINAAKIFHLAGEKWTLPSYGWDQTNFGLFSGDDSLGGFMAANIYMTAQRLRAKRIVVSECGHGYRSARWEGHNWVGSSQEIMIESVIVTILRYLDEGRINVDRTRNIAAVTFHDSCNVARFGDLLEEPRIILEKVCSDFREMHPNRMQNFCCNGGSGLLVMPEYRSLRLEAAKIKAEQLKTTKARIVCTMCHNCREALADIIDHFQLDMEVVQIMDLVARALLQPEKKTGDGFSAKTTAPEYG